MFRRLLFEDAAALFTLVAFITAVSIFVTIAWRALRMKRPQVERFENLPFATPTPESAGPPLAGGPSRLSGALRDGPAASAGPTLTSLSS